ncbi:MAG: UDP-2,3-diacylglucosamine diphosphatase LpxI [Proteobacteria bacterium]|nr:UDP-2,3-diacylglucosamine diphosphatase LpxI [Pseudomonadota bacterium]
MDIKKEEIGRVGIIAGAGALPRHVYDACLKQGLDVFVIGLDEHVSYDLFEDVDYESLAVHNVSKILGKLHNAGVTHVVLAGRVERANLSRLLLDIKGVVLLAKIMKNGLNDNALLSTVVSFLEQEGFIIVPPEAIAKDIVVQKGVLTRKQPDKAAMSDIKTGLKTLRNIAALDVGQALVIQSGLVLGVEAAEGTDELVRRCGLIQQKDEHGPILIKIAKPHQDRRVDLPCIGAVTIAEMKKYGLVGIAVEAGSSLMLDGNETIKVADENEIFIVGI